MIAAKVLLILALVAFRIVITTPSTARTDEGPLVAATASAPLQDEVTTVRFLRDEPINPPNTGHKPIPYEKKPQLHPMLDYHVINASDTFTLRCAGHWPVSWVVPDDEYQSSPRYNIDYEVIPGNNPRPYISHLRIENLLFNDTGSYYCRYNGTSSNDVIDNVTRTYLFVRDPKNLFVTSARYMWYNVLEYIETVLPCAPTDPEIEMEIIKDGTNITGSLDSMLLKYDPMRGLIVTRGTAKFHTGMIKCHATQPSTGVQDEVVLVLNFQNVEMPPPPFIVEPSESPLFIGRGMVIECQLPLDRGMPHIELEWGLPLTEAQLEDGLDSGRILIGSQNRSRVREGDYLYELVPDEIILSRTLEITNLTLNDKGNYTCKGIIAETEIASPEQEYQLSYLADPTKPTIQSIKVEGHPLITIDKRTRWIRWVISIDTYPEPGLTWIHPAGHEIDYNKLKKYEMDVNLTLGVVKLKIDNVGLDDTGEYLLNVEVKATKGNEVLERNVSLVLEYLSDPTIDIQIGTKTPRKRNKYKFDLYPFEEEYELTCTMRGYPLDTTKHTWTFKECTQSYDDCLPSEEELQPVSFKPTDGNVNRTYNYEYTSIIKIPANQSRSGIYACSICTRYEPTLNKRPVCETKTVPFFVTDYPPGFRVDGPKQSIIQKEPMEMTCAASIYEFTTVSWHRKGPENNWDPVPSDLVSHRSTNFSHIATVRTEEVRLSDAGMYRCRATYKDDLRGIAAEDYGFTVRKIEPPSKASGNNMNGSEIIVQASEEVYLDCSTTGVPTPKVAWFKDEQSLDQAYIGNSTTMEILHEEQSLHIKFAALDDSGDYVCTSSNSGGTISSHMIVKVKQKSHLSIGLIVGLLAGFIVLLCLIIFLCWKVKVYNRKYKELTRTELQLFEAGDPTSINPELGVDDQADLLPYNRDFEFPRERLRLGKQLGAGAFGRVLKAHAQGIVSWERSTTVAVKMVKPHADITYIRALMAELKIMIHLGKHLNIVNLLGACTTNLNKRELLVIVEYCRFGNIQKYLLLHRNHYINQIDPHTCEIDFTIGQDIIEGHGNDLPRAREEDEMSAAYRRRLQSISTTAGETTSATFSPVPEGYVDMGTAEGGGAAAAAALPTPEKLPNGEGPANKGNGNHLKPPRQASVRYISDPANPPVKRNRQVSIQSDYNDGLDAQVTTDMTMLSDSTSTGPLRYDRSTSTISKQGPGWRANMRGDYDVQTIRPISTKDLICWNYQVARGMEYLASKKVMHGDLACRNILLAADNVVKICDFGLAKDIYKTNTYRKKTDGPLPIKWMAMESLGDRVFSTQSDIWSFGVVLWEMFSLGKTPYPGIEPTANFYDMLLRGYRMEKPEFCPRSIYRTMIDCWNADPNKRPSFKFLMDFLGDLLEDGDKDHYLDLSKAFAKSHSCDPTAPTSSAEGVTNINYLMMMQAPDYTTQMSIQSPAVEETEDGYLLPRRGTSPSATATPTIEEEDESGYLVPSSNKLSTLSTPAKSARSFEDDAAGEEIELRTLIKHKDDNGSAVNSNE